MNKNVSILSSCLLALALATPQAAGAQQMVKPLIPALRGVTLTASETSQITPIVQSYKLAHPKGSAPDPGAHKQMIAQILAALTPTQRAQVKANIAAMRAKQTP